MSDVCCVNCDDEGIVKKNKKYKDEENKKRNIVKLVIRYIILGILFHLLDDLMRSNLLLILFLLTNSYEWILFHSAICLLDLIKVKVVYLTQLYKILPDNINDILHRLIAGPPLLENEEYFAAPLSHWRKVLKMLMML